MELITGDQPTQYGIFHPVHSNITAGNDVNINPVVNNVTVNNSSGSSILTRLKTSLSPVTSANYDSYEAKGRSECFPNTRIQVHNDIEAWIHAESHQTQIYFLDGVAGIGKSTIAQTIAAKAAAVGLLGGSFFFTREEELRKVARYFFPTIAYQLACYDNHFATSISLSLEKTPDAPAKRLDQQMSLLWLEPLGPLLSQKSRSTLLVVDALDECEEDNAEELLSLLGQHIHQMKGLKVLITLRPEAHLRNVLNQDKHHERFRLHEIEDSIVHSDIRVYLQCRLSTEEVSKVSRYQRTPWQPTARDIDTLCSICGTLFIIAATAAKFILDCKRLNPERQLSRLLDGASSSSGSNHTRVLDETYMRIILAGQSDIADGDEDWFRDLNKVLGALIALANPLPCNALASLLEMNWEDVEATLSPLHSLVAPSGSGPTMIFRIHHKSFPDFITNRERIQQVRDCWKPSNYQGLDSLLWVDIRDQHLQLAKACFRTMNHALRWNMMGISERDWYKDRADLPHVFSQCISPDLAYATLHWASHLRSAHGFMNNMDLQSYVDEWASRHILAWMEVMVILKQVNEIYRILEDAIDSLKCITSSVWTERVRVQELLSDATRFVQQGSDVMRLSPMHIYRSCLPFVPTDTALGKTYNRRAMLKISYGASTHWHALLAVLVGHSGEVTSVSFSSDSCRLVSVSRSPNSSVRLWNAKTGTCIATFDAESNGVVSVAFSTDRFQIVFTEDQRIRRWDVNTGALVSDIASFSPDFRLVRLTVLSSDGSRLAFACTDNIVRILDAKTGAQVMTLASRSKYIWSIAFSTDGGQLAIGSSDKRIRLWDANTGARLFTLAGHSKMVCSFAFSNNGSRLASGSEDKTIRLRDLSRGAYVFTLTGHTDSVCSVAFSSNDSRLASGSRDTTIRLWDTKTGVHVSTLTGHSLPVSALAFSDDGSRLASASYDSRICLWDPKEATHSSSTIGHLDMVWCIAFSNDGSLLASASYDPAIKLWDVANGAYKCALLGHSKLVSSIAFSSDVFRLASGSHDKTIRLWDLKTGARALTLTGHSEVVIVVAFSSDDSVLASGSGDNSVRLWDAKSGACISTFLGHSTPVMSVAFAAKISLLASGSQDNTVRLWDTKTGAHISTLSVDPGLVTSVVFFNNDSQLAIGLPGGTIQFWDVKECAHTFTLTTPGTATVHSIVLLRDDSQMVNRLASCSNQLFQHGSQDRHTNTLALVGRNDRPISGLIMASSLSKMGGTITWEASVVCWFPLNLEVTSFAVDHVNSKVAVGCKNGRVMIFDFSSNSLQMNSD